MQEISVSSPPSRKNITPYATTALVLAWVILGLGVIGFMGSIGQRGYLVVAFGSLLSGVFGFALLGVLSEITRLIANQDKNS